MSFTQFLKEKQYLQNVSSNTLRWYKHALKWLPCESPDERQIKQMVVSMREAGLKATGCNAATRAINCYLHWSSGTSGRCSSSCKHPKIQPLREPQMVFPTFTTEQVKLLLNYRPKTAFQRRLHLLVMVLFDTGARIGEALAIQADDIDLDNLLLLLHGKGAKERKVPISFELRKALFRYMGDKPGRLFVASTGRTWGRMGALRSVKLHCQKLGFTAPPRTLHSCRHTMATNYLRRGGSVAHLSRVLGHTTIAMTMRYVHLQTGDLSAVHQKISLLS
jgi:integrase/recombinase XerD